MSEKSKEQRTDDFLADVVDTIARYGNRNVPQFCEAFSTAQTALEYSDAYRYADAVAQMIRLGLQSYVPGALYFEAAVAVEYAALLAKFNSI